MLQRVWDLDKAPNTSIEKRAALARPAAGIPAKSRTGLHHWQSNTLPTNVTHNTFDEPVNINSVMNRLRRSITKRGLRAAVDVVKHFYAADDDVDDLLDMYDFRRACQVVETLPSRSCLPKPSQSAHSHLNLYSSKCLNGWTQLMPTTCVW